jgi:adenine-specific DNA-methyltransferase
LLADAEESYHAAYRVSENDIFDNSLIFGDNLLALKALEEEFPGRFKCIFIDTPYNTLLLNTMMMGVNILSGFLSSDII